MTWFQTALLGALEGFTEFLPISSTAHLLLASRLFGIPETEFGKSFVIAIQLGAILAVAGLYFRRLWTDWRTNSKLAVAFLPSAVFGFFLYRLLKDVLFEDTALMLQTLFWGGAGIILLERFHRERPDAKDIPDISYRDAFLVGCAQALAIVPGVSRAGATIAGGLLLNVKRSAIVEFSFLLAIPTMLAATAYDLMQSAPAFNRGELGLLAGGFAVSALFAVFSVKFLLRYVKTHDFTAFGWYRMALAAVLWMLLL